MSVHCQGFRGTDYSEPDVVEAFRVKQNQARLRTQAAVRAGTLIKPQLCEKCLQPTPSARLHAHHENYDKPLFVWWLCQQCHGAQRKTQMPKVRIAIAAYRGRD